MMLVAHSISGAGGPTLLSFLGSTISFQVGIVIKAEAASAATVSNVLALSCNLPCSSSYLSPHRVPQAGRWPLRGPRPVGHFGAPGPGPGDGRGAHFCHRESEGESEGAVEPSMQEVSANGCDSMWRLGDSGDSGLVIWNPRGENV